MIHYLSELNKENLKGKKVLLRVDFNVAVDKKTGSITEDFRVKSHRETINYLINNEAKVMLVSHISSIESFLAITGEIGDIIDQTITLVSHGQLEEIDKLFKVAPIFLLENIRQASGEESNSEELAAKLADDFDLYVNDAFSVSHRNHTSVSAITKKLPAYGGFLINKETNELRKAIEAPPEGKIIVLGGAKISTKLPVIENFLDKADKILIGGAIANNFFKMNGITVGESLVDDDLLNLKNLDLSKIILPEDVLISDDETGSGEIRHSKVNEAGIGPVESIFDIGIESIDKFSEIIESSQMVVWNGPMGVYEIDAFSIGTKKISQAIANVKVSIIGGGDTITAAGKLGLLNKFTFVSTGGGAMLTFLSGKELPGLKVLGYYN